MIAEGYKETEVGVIPDDWRVYKLGDVGDVKMCKRIFSYQTTKKGDVPFYKIGTFGKEPDAYIDKDLYKEFRRKYSFPKKGYLLISASGTIGRTVEYNGEDAYYQDSNIIWLDNDESIITNEYLKYTLQVIKYNTEGSTIKRLYNSIIKSSIFVIPPSLKEQEAIAKVLTDTDNLIQALEKVITKKKAIKKGAMQQLLTPPNKGGKRLPGFSGDWIDKSLGESSILKARIGWQGLTTNEYLKTGEYCLVTGTDFNNGVIDWDNCVYVEKERYIQDINIQLKVNDILVTKDGTIGKVAFVDKLNNPTTLNSGVFVLRPIKESYLPKYLYHVLMSRHFKSFLSKLTAGSTISHLYQKDFVYYSFSVPPTKGEQEAIATVLSDMDKEIEALEVKKEKYMQLKKGVAQELLTGKTRLV